MSPTDARYAAQRAFGNMDSTKEEVRDTRRVRNLENLMRDLRYSLRGLERSALLVVAATTSIALGAVGNIVIFSLARKLLFSAPDVRDPHTLVKNKPTGSTAKRQSPSPPCS